MKCPFCGSARRRGGGFHCGTSDPDDFDQYTTGRYCNERCFRQVVIRYDDAVLKVLQGLEKAWNASGASREQLHEWGQILRTARDRSERTVREFDG